MVMDGIKPFHPSNQERSLILDELKNYNSRTMSKDIWYCKDFNFHQVLCPYKLEDHVKKNPNNIYSKNDFLFMEDDNLKYIVLIDCGKVKVGQYDQGGQEKVFGFLGKGDVLGQMGLIGETSYRYFAEVMEDGTQICKMSVERARALTRDYVPFALEINRRINGHIRKLERRIEILLYKNIKTRILEFIKDLAQDHGRDRNGGIWISHSLTQSDIAALIGTSRKSASLLLNELENEGLIDFDRKHFFIKKPDQLFGQAISAKEVLF